MYACPVCLTEFDRAAPTCPECGADIAGTWLDTAPGPSTTMSAPAPASVPDAPSMDELESLFRAQFERHEVRLPREWIERLRTLAAEAQPARRMATVFFVDICGYARLTRTLTGEQHDELLSRFFALCTHSVERFGGFIVRMMGDCVYAAFGAPWALERDSEGALQALLAIREGLRTWSPIGGESIAFSAGATMGVVDLRILDVQGRRMPDLFGTIVNLAARLQSAAAPWEILVSDALRDQVAGVFDFEAGEEFVPKNFGASVRPYRVLRHRGAQAVRRRTDIPFVGRAPELAIVRAWFDRAAEGAFVRARLEGEPGIGKSRLLAEVLAHLDPARVRVARAFGEPASSYRPLAHALEWLRDLAGDANAGGRTFAALCELSQELLKVVQEGMEPRDRGGQGEGDQRVTERRCGSPSPQTNDEIGSFRTSCELPAPRDAGIDPTPTIGYILDVEPHASALRQLGGSELRAQLLAGLAAYFAGVARARPLALILDDAQWADPMTAELLDGLEDLAPPGLLLLTIRRPDATLLPGAPAPECPDLLTLATLDDAERLELLGHLVPLQQLHPLDRARLMRDAEANPLYLTEIALSLAAPAHSAPDGEPSAVPATLLEVLQARIDHLDTHRRAILQCSAVIGARFGYRLAAAVHEAERDLLGELHVLRGLRMLDADESVAGDILFTFRPTLLREVGYRMLTQEQREELHRRVAHCIETRFPERRQDFAWELAFHWSRGDEPERARPFLYHAATRALRTGGAREALELLRPVLEAAATPLPDDRAAVRVALQQRALLFEVAGFAARTIGDCAMSAHCFAQCLALARETGQERWILNARHQLAWEAINRAEYATAELELADLLPPDGSLAEAEIANTRGVLQWRSGRLDEAQATFRRILEHPAAAEPERAPVVAEAGNNLGLVLWQRGAHHDALRHFRAALDAKRRLGQVTDQVFIQNNIAMILEQTAPPARALAAYDEARALADACGYLAGACLVEGNRANILLQMHQWTAAESAAAAALHLARRSRNRTIEALALENLGMALAGRGLLDHARAHLRQASQLGAEIGDPSRRDSPRLALAWIALLAGDPRAAQGPLGLLPPDIPLDLAAWRAQIHAGLAALSGKSDALPAPERLAAIAPPITPREEFARWLDLAEALAARRLPCPLSPDHVAAWRTRLATDE